ncbi:MAG: bifunctional metallophosphatase/5'-nucleotidase, partial [Tenericutes bacterium]|nr:bifunctional metallophosphatase/5'-nucleotidase [Mycoplasmatota bacterium]
TTESTTTESTTTAIDRYQEIKLYSINDFHGGTYSDISYLEQIGDFLINQKESIENTVILSNGDIFQGAALSNYYHGLPIADVFSYVGFDGFIIGNHEFDWGIDVILDYQDGNLENGEMDYPILAANIVYEDTQEPLENTVPYIIKEFNGVKVGVIGLIGDVINSISASRVENIEFLDPAATAYDFASILRTEQDCDIVVVYIHEGSSINYQLADFTGDSYIDAVFNGHTHQDEASTISRLEGSPLVYAQSRNSDNSLFSEITLTYDLENREVTNGSAKNYSYSEISSFSNSEIVDIIDYYQDDLIYVNYVSQVLTTATRTLYRGDLTPWGASVIRDYADVDVGAINSGGFRNSMEYGELTMGDFIEIYPFDNYIKTSRLTGEQLLNFYEDILYYNEDITFDDQLTYDGTNLYIDGNLVLPSVLYTVGAVDYIFDKEYYDFLEGQDITLTTYLMRDLLVLDLFASNNSFDPINGTYYQEIAYFFDYSYYKDLEEYLYI